MITDVENRNIQQQWIKKPNVLELYSCVYRLIQHFNDNKYTTGPRNPKNAVLPAEIHALYRLSCDKSIFPFSKTISLQMTI
jgi:hypothetical protein